MSEVRMDPHKANQINYSQCDLILLLLLKKRTNVI